jgi:transposase
MTGQAELTPSRLLPSPIHDGYMHAMSVDDVNKLLQSESRACRYLLRFCWKNHQRFCPRCRHRKNYKLSDQRRRCARCAYTFHDFSGRWINNGDLSCRQWLQIITFFALDYTVLAMSRELDLTYNTVYKAVSTLRCAIAAGAADAREFFKAGQGLFPHPSKRAFRAPSDGRLSPLPVFGITEHAHHAHVALLPGLLPQTVFHLYHDVELRFGKLGKIFFTSPYQEFDSLLFCSHVPPPRFINPDTILDPPLTGAKTFLAFVLEHSRRFKGLTPERFPLYIKELEFRHNNKYQNLLPLLAETACRFVPNLE